jgi:tRNA pseudouridine55 synthase
MRAPSLGPSGFLPVYKPSGMTSFDVIRRLRRSLGVRKMGHSGVLDRPANGVLVIGLNSATRLFELFGGFEKEYIGDAWIGLTTDTDDLTGELLATYPTAGITREKVAAALARYVGSVAQIPPQFSLTKKDGRELYRYALAGQAVEVEAKTITVLANELREFEDDLDPAVVQDFPESGVLEGRLLPQLGQLGRLIRAQVWVRCTGGMYIRSLARDLGADVGSGATLGYLIRTRVGPFGLDDCLTLEQIEARVEAGATAADLVSPLASIAAPESSFDLDPTQLSLVRSGRNIRRLRKLLPPGANTGDTVFGLGAGSELVAVLSVEEANSQGLVELRPLKVIAH